MGENKKYYWLKLKEDFFRQAEIKKLRKIAGGDTYTIIYLKMQLLSLKKEGRLYFTGIEENFIEEVALEIDEEAENVRITVMYLMKCKLLEELNENEFLLNKATLSIGNETQGAERIRKFRDNKKEVKALQCNTTVTKCNTERREKREELDIYKEQIETLWSLYPNKKGKAAAIKSIPKLLKVMEYEELKRCVERYIKASKKTEVQFLQYGSTFFNGGYMDYKDSDINKVIKPKMEIEVKPYE